MRARAAWLVTVIGLLLTGCTAGPPTSEGAAEVELRPTPGWRASSTVPAPPATSPRPRPWDQPVLAHAVSRSSLVPYTGCADYLDRVKREALDAVGPWGLPLAGGPVGVMMRAAPVAPGSAADAPAAGTATGGGGPGFSGTNNQEAGVEEADQVKTDGRLLLTIRNRPVGLQVVDVSSEEPRLRGFLPLGDRAWGAQLLLVGRRAVVLSQSGRQTGERYVSLVDVRVVSLADPDLPRVERSFEVEGSLTAAREIAGRVLLVTQSDPGLAWTYPADGTARAERAALAANRRLIRASTLGDWLPSVRDPRSGRTYRGSCTGAMHGQSRAGSGSTSLLSLDPAADRPGEQVTVSGSGAAVYASTRSVYVTTWPWAAQTGTTDPDERDVVTDVHRFDVTDPADPWYAGSGSVPGTLIGQYAMSEHEGHLRVASTLGRTWAMQGEEPPSDNLVTVLRVASDRLHKVGQVRGLGRGERIHSVRFLGNLGYVVTFRQTDPLYALDLSDPERPVRRGELHVTGYSSYLHPVDDGRLLGIGQEVSANRPVGTQVSTFDVQDGRRPLLESRLVFDGAWSAAEHDPHAVLWWPASRLVVVPLQVWDEGPTGEGRSWTGAVALRVGPEGSLVEVARLTHPDDTPSSGASAPACCESGILRSVVVGDSLLTLSERGVLAVSVDTFEVRQWSPYR